MARSSAVYDITAKDKAEATIKKVKGAFSDLDSVVGKLTGGLSLLGAANVGVFAAIYKSQAPVIDQLAKTAQKLGVTTQALQAMRDAGERAGISNNKVDMSLQRMSRRIAEAAQGTGEAVKGLDALGLSASDLIRLSPDQQFAAISKELEGVENASQKVQLAFKFFDSEGVDMLRLTGRSVSEAASEMDRLGISISRVDAAQVEAANDSIQIMRRNTTGLSQQFAAQLAPAITGVVRQMLTLDSSTINVRESMIDMVDASVTALGFLGDTINLLKQPFEGMYLLGQKTGVLTLQLMEKLGMATQAEVDRAKSIFDKSYIDIEVKINSEPFSEELKRNVELARAQARAAARDIQSELEKSQNTSNIIQFPTNGKGKKETKNKSAIGVTRDAAKDDLDLLLDIYEQEERANAERHARLQAGYDLEKKQLTELEKFKQKSYKDQTQQVLGELLGLTQGVAQHNRQLFELNKAAGIANAIVNTYEGVSKTLAKYPWPLSGIMAGAHLAAGLAQVQAIRSASFGGGGGSAPSLAGSPGTPVTETGSVNNTTDATSAQPVIVVNNYGMDFGDQEKYDNQTTLSIQRALDNDKLTYRNGRLVANVA